MGKYIIRFREENEIKTLKFYDKESVEYFEQILEKQNKDYIIIKISNNNYKLEVNNLLDFEI